MGKAEPLLKDISWCTSGDTLRSLLFSGIEVIQRLRIKVKKTKVQKISIYILDKFQESIQEITCNQDKSCFDDIQFRDAVFYRRCKKKVPFSPNVISKRRRVIGVAEYIMLSYSFCLFQLGHEGKASKNVWITDCVVLPNVKKLALSTADREIGL